MAKKRSVFDIDFTPDVPEAPERFPAGNPEPEPAPPAAPTPPTRRGPMASAITETADAARGRAEAPASRSGRS